MSPRKTVDQQSHPATPGCNHPLAVLFDPSDGEMSRLEQVLARCPVCSRWSPGDGPILAIVSSPTITDDGPEELV